jgi:hypothetical protein
VVVSNGACLTSKDKLTQGERASKVGFMNLYHLVPIFSCFINRAAKMAANDSSSRSKLKSRLFSSFNRPTLRADMKRFYECHTAEVGFR